MFFFRNIYNNQNFLSIHVLICTWFGSGLLSPMSGTWGTLAALPIAYIVTMYGNITILIFLILIFYVVGILSINKYFLNYKIIDRSEIVIDEVVGVWIATLNCNNITFKWILAFVIFRILDIAKPWPANFFDKKTTSPHSIMLDMRYMLCFYI